MDDPSSDLRIVALAEIRSGLLETARTPASAYLFHGIVDLVVAVALLTVGPFVLWAGPVDAQTLEVIPDSRPPQTGAASSQQPDPDARS